MDYALPTPAVFRYKLRADADPIDEATQVPTWSVASGHTELALKTFSLQAYSLSAAKNYAGIY
jgi:hypothetical protein